MSDNNIILLDESAISKMLDLAHGNRARRLIRLFFNNRMTITEISNELLDTEANIEKQISFIQTIAKQNLKQRTCVDCGKTFYTARTQPVLCPNCLLSNKKEKEQKMFEEHKKPTVNSKPKPIGKPGTKDIHKIIRKMVKYNKEHNTKYDYGEFVQKIGG